MLSILNPFPTRNITKVHQIYCTFSFISLVLLCDLLFSVEIEDRYSRKEQKEYSK